jgi:hypothetical protein
MTTQANTKAAVAQPAVTLTPEALQAVIAQAIAEHEAAKQAKTQADGSAQMDALTARTFKKRGYTDIQPRINILTYNKWIEQGRRVKTGEKGVPVKQFRLFHISQTEPISEAEKTAFLAERAAKTADKLPKPSPVAEPAKPAPKANGKSKRPTSGQRSQQPSA